MLASASLLALCAWSAGTGLADRPAPVSTAAAEAPAQLTPADRKAYFGELHLHTTMSFDAWTFGTKVTPDMAYRFARGETVMVPSAQVGRQQEISVSGPVPAKRKWPLDFAAVTDHSEYLGAVAQLDVPGSAFSQTPIGKSLAAGGRGAFFRAGEAIRGVKNESTEALAAAAKAADGWGVEMAATQANYQPGRFTTLLAYEWTSSPGQGIHMHRNVIFNVDHAPPPFTSVDSNRPADLWKFMTSIRGKDGLDVLAIPHNSNLSDGREFDWNDWDGKPIDAAYALSQSINEPLVEMAQTKGASETTPELSPSDEFANFEVMDRLYAGEKTSKIHGSYVREGLGRGLVIGAKVGANPFKMGFVGASDIHNGLSASDEAASVSSSQAVDPKTMPLGPDRARAALGMTGQGKQLRPNGQQENDPLQMSSAAITGVWAEENTRPAIFAALKRKETFATTGTRIRVRLFGGWSFSAASLKARDWVAKAYAQGAPMGGDLPGRAGGGAPRFIVQAAKDPDGANLDRIQIVKLALAGDGYKETVFDVALSGGRKADPKTGKASAVGNTVDLATGAYRNTIGAPTLTTVWTDPAFDPAAPALYYARVLEIPTPRWSTLVAIRAHLPLPKAAPATIQERAWSSPIWYAPAKARLANAAQARPAG
jgi:hypothetical protein